MAKARIISDEVIASTIRSQSRESPPFPLPDGVLEVVSPHIHDGSVIPRGRIYVRVMVLDLADELVCVPWADYVESESNISALPRIPVFAGWKVVVEATQTARGSDGVQVAAHIVVNTHPEANIGGGNVHYGAPGVGRGEMVAFDLGNPAAGADYNTFIVPVLCEWALRAFGGTLVTEAVVANRRHLQHLTSPMGRFATAAPSVDQTISQTITYASSAGGSANNITALSIVMNPPYSQGGRLRPGYYVTFETRNLQAGDNWGSGTMEIEEWAVPE